MAAKLDAVVEAPVVLLATFTVPAILFEDCTELADVSKVETAAWDVASLEAGVVDASETIWLAVETAWDWLFASELDKIFATSIEAWVTTVFWDCVPSLAAAVVLVTSSTWVWLLVSSAETWFATPTITRVPNRTEQTPTFNLRIENRLIRSLNKSLPTLVILHIYAFKYLTPQWG